MTVNYVKLARKKAVDKNSEKKRKTSQRESEYQAKERNLKNAKKTLRRHISQFDGMKIKRRTLNTQIR